MCLPSSMADFVPCDCLLQKAHLLPNLPSVIDLVVTYRRLKSRENFKLLVLEVVAVATRGSCLSEVPNTVIRP